MLTPTEISELLGELEEAPIAFFSDLLVEILAEASDAEVRRHAASLPRLILPRSTEREELERVLPTGRLDGAQVKTLALHVWHQRMLATQSYVGE